MNKWKMYAIVMGLIALGSLNELFRVLTSDAPDIAANRNAVVPIALLMSGAFVFLTFRFWRKSRS